MSRSSVQYLLRDFSFLGATTLYQGIPPHRDWCISTPGFALDAELMTHRLRWGFLFALKRGMMVKHPNIKKWRDGLTAAGLCQNCGKRPRNQSWLLCIECGEGKKAYYKRRRANLEAAGLCKDCGQRPRDGEKRLCAECMQTTNARQNSDYEKKRQRIVEYMGGKCIDCQNTFPAYVYDLHHLDESKKEFVLSGAMSKKPLEKIQPELDKCVLLCANCHRIRHYAK